MMKHALWLAALALAFGLPAAAQVADETAVPRMAVADLKKAVDAGRVLVVDVRDPGSYADGHIPGAINVTLDALPQKLAQLQGAKKAIVTYCA